MHHILFVHGIGVHAETWLTTTEKGDAQSVSDQFFALLKQYPALSGVDPEAVKLHSIHYDDEILKLFKNWADQVKNLKDGLSSSPILKDEASRFTTVIDAASDAQQNGDFKFTHLMDLLLFAGSPSIQDRLVTYVGRQVIELIKANQGDRFSIIGHSMGTAMAHKVIQALFNESVVDDKGNRITLPGNFRFECVVMVANCSFALSRDRANHYVGMVRPSFTIGAGCCTKWINVNHRLDPVGMFLPFDCRKNPQWLDPRVEVAGFHRDIRLTAVSKPSIHALSHYLADPVFHVPLFELLFAESFTQKQRDSAVVAFQSKTPEGMFKSLTSHLETLDVSNTNSFLQFFNSVKSFLGVVRQFV